jgi:hypothetical protein
MPAGYPSMSPYLICQHAERLIGFPKDAFGSVSFTQVTEVGIDDGVVMIDGGTTEFYAQGCISLFGATAAVSQHDQMSDDIKKPWRSFRCRHASGCLLVEQVLPSSLHRTRPIQATAFGNRRGRVSRSCRYFLCCHCMNFSSRAWDFSGDSFAVAAGAGSETAGSSLPCIF